MKIAIISDTHDNLKNLEKALDWIKKQDIKTILHCGDIATQDTVDFANKNFDGKIFFVKGNADHGLDIPPEIEIELGGRKIAFAHFPDKAKQMAQSGNFDIVFYGHTHRPWEEKVGKCFFVNPGEMAGQFYKPSFAVYDTATEKLELKILEKL